MVSRKIAALSVIASISGCTTTYVGHKLPPNGQLPAGTSTGIPFVMTKPEYSVDIAADASDPAQAVYTLKATDVPDAAQRYTIALDPALLVDGTFDYTFGEQGNLTGASATSTSRVVATLESAVTFAIKTAAAAAALDMGTALGQYRAMLKTSKAASCTKNKTNLQIDNLIAQLSREALSEQTSGDPKAKEKAASLAVSRFHYLDQNQKACLAAVATEADAEAKKLSSTPKSNYDNALNKAKAAATDAMSTHWLAMLEEAVKKRDVAAIEKLAKSNVPSAVKNVSSQAKTLANAELDAKRLSLMANQFATMAPDVWRARHLQYLENQLSQKKLEQLVLDRNGRHTKQLDDTISRLNEEWATTLGEPRLVQRVAELDMFLTRVRVVPSGGGQQARYAAAEYVQLREERDKLQDRIDKIRSELLAKNKFVDAGPEKSKIAARTDVSVPLVKSTFIETVEKNPGVYSDLPEYVLVVVGPMEGPVICSTPPCKQ